MNDGLKEIQKDVDEMSKALGEPEGLTTEAPGTEAPGTEAPGTEAPGTEAPSTEAPSTEAPSTEAPSTEAPSTEAPEDKDAIIAKLREQIEDGAGGPKTKAPSTEAPGTSAPSTEAPIEDQDFMGDLDLDDVIRDPKEFNKLLNKVYVKGVKDARVASPGVSAEAVSGLVASSMTMAEELKKTSDEFFETNKDLKPFRKVVATVFEDIQTANPDKGYKDLMGDIAKETRSRLELPIPKAQKKKKTKTPKLPRKKSSQSRHESHEDEGFDSELDAMEEALNN